MNVNWVFLGKLGLLKFYIFGCLESGDCSWVSPIIARCWVCGISLFSKVW